MSRFHFSTTTRPVLAAASLVLLTACSSSPPTPDWQMNAQSSVQRFTAAYMEGNAPVEGVEFQRARAEVAATGQVDLVLRTELIRCATRVASLVFEDCSGYLKLSEDAAPAERAYANYLAGRIQPQNAALLPEPQRAVANAGSDEAAAAAAQAIADPLSKLVAAGVLLRAGRATPALLDTAVATASAQGWRRPLLAWLGVQAQRAEQAGDGAAAQRIRRRMALAAP